jgi:hypothetical protein
MRKHLFSPPSVAGKPHVLERRAAVAFGIASDDRGVKNGGEDITNHTMRRTYFLLGINVT